RLISISPFNFKPSQRKIARLANNNRMIPIKNDLPKIVFIKKWTLTIKKNVVISAASRKDFLPFSYQYFPTSKIRTKSKIGKRINMEINIEKNAGTRSSLLPLKTLYCKIKKF